MTVKNFVSIVVLSFVGIIPLSGCNSDSGQPRTDSVTPVVAEQAMRGGGGSGAAGFSCGPLGCICNGDWDCNNMFGSGVCDGVPSKCYERGPAPVYCICAPWVGAREAGKGTAPRTGPRTASPQ